MLNLKGIRELCYVVKVDSIHPIEGADRVEVAGVGGWRIMVRKDQFKPGDYAIYFEIDSKVPEVEPFMFLAAKHFKIKTQKYFKGTVISQGLLMSIEDFTSLAEPPAWAVSLANRIAEGKDVEHEGLTEVIGVTYADAEDNKRKANSADKYKLMAQRRPDLFKKSWAKWMMKREWGRKVMFFFFGKKKDKATAFPTQFPFVKRTDQERAENMVYILQDKTPFIKTQKCDGSSGTYILSRKKFGRFEFFVCSRNVRQLTPNQKSYYDDNYYWEVAIKYDIENKLKDFLKKHPELDYVCWQGEICSPGIQKNPHKLTETHFYCFHMIDSKRGKWDIREAKKVWDEYKMETVPIICDNYILPDDFEEFKLDADGFYDPSVCEGNKNCDREGWVLYSTKDPNFSFKNVSRTYLLKN